jgi:hypothetical protein
MTMNITTEATSVPQGTAMLERREHEDHDEIVHRDLHQRVVRVPVGEVAPDEDHGRARRHAEQDHARDDLRGVLRGDHAREREPEEEHAERRHRERLDEPVDDEGEREPPGLLADILEARRLHLQHHRVDHQPDEHRDDQVDAGDLEPRNELKSAGEHQAKPHADADGQRDP